MYLIVFIWQFATFINASACGFSKVVSAKKKKKKKLRKLLSGNSRSVDKKCFSEFIVQEISSLTEARELFLAQKLELQEQVKTTEGELQKVGSYTVALNSSNIFGFFKFIKLVQ